MLIPEPSASPPHTALHHRRSGANRCRRTTCVIRADIQDQPTKIPAFPLNHFKHDGDDILVVLGNRTYGIQIERHTHESGDKWLEPSLYLAVARCREGCQRASGGVERSMTMIAGASTPC